MIADIEKAPKGQAMLEGQTHSNEGEQQDTLTDVEDIFDETLTQLRQLQRQHLTPERWRELKS